MDFDIDVEDCNESNNSFTSLNHDAVICEKCTVLGKDMLPIGADSMLLSVFILVFVNTASVLEAVGATAAAVQIAFAVKILKTM